jgi:hypothetical protein
MVRVTLALPLFYNLLRVDCIGEPIAARAQSYDCRSVRPNPFCGLKALLAPRLTNDTAIGKVVGNLDQ